MKIAFEKQDIGANVGQYWQLFYDYIALFSPKVIRGGQNKPPIGNNWRIVDDSPSGSGLQLDNDISWSWFSADEPDAGGNKNYQNLRWEGLGIYVEGAYPALANTNVPAWLPNNTYSDENGDPVQSTFENWGAEGNSGVTKISIDNTKCIVKLHLYGDLDAGDIDSLIPAAAGLSATIMLIKEVRTAIEPGGDYTAPLEV